MKIEDKLQEVGQYFKDKILNGEFEFVDCDQYTAKVKIDGKYEFNMWISSNQKDSFSFYGGYLNSSTLDNAGFVDEYLTFKTQKERLKAWGHLRPHVKKYNNDILLKQKRIQLEKLKKELGE